MHVKRTLSSATIAVYLASLLVQGQQPPPPQQGFKLLSTQQPAPPPQPATILYNNIRLVPPWPPHQAELTLEPMPVPYLTFSPSAVNIDVGRQFFVDNFLIDTNTLKRTFHSAEYHTNNPVMKLDKPWEALGNSGTPFSVSVWHDPNGQLFKMWYTAGKERKVCLATSLDGFTWEKTNQDVVKDTNIVLPEECKDMHVMVDLFDNDLQRYKLLRVDKENRTHVYFSTNGIHWGKPVVTLPAGGEFSKTFHNPVRRVWIHSHSVKSRFGSLARKYFEFADLINGEKWGAQAPSWWVGADKLDAPFTGSKAVPNLAWMDTTYYESLMLGLFTLTDGLPVESAAPNRIQLGYSRDGFFWDRPDRRPFFPLPTRPLDWNWRNFHPSTAGPLIVARKLFFYLAGQNHTGEGAVGLATIRRDGFVSMDADASGGTLTTWPLIFNGKYLFANAATDKGELKVEVLDDKSNAIAGFSRDKSMPYKQDMTLGSVIWEGGPSFTNIIGKQVRFRFYVTNGGLYSFWTSPGGRSGPSQGFGGAYGPNYTGPVDTIGNRSYSPVNRNPPQPAATNATPPGAKADTKK
jgi:hypothetical protein